ncbi:MAG: hypothetical protein LBF39_05195, partial [Prevotellaceae bacterium]|nr:hypothetical protein [Prevotellaceae bacterium]
SPANPVSFRTEKAILQDETQKNEAKRSRFCFEIHRFLQSSLFIVLFFVYDNYLLLYVTKNMPQEEIKN